MKKIEKKAIKFYKAALPTIYLSPAVFCAYSFITFFQWSS
tara:strand:+ start:176 stop:295 length:120 start_codon:yes stop_codon:yes gene_type:complete